jgi:hypothetical protein
MQIMQAKNSAARLRYFFVPSLAVNPVCRVSLACDGGGYQAALRAFT